MNGGAQSADPPADASERPARPAKELPPALEAEVQRRGAKHRDWIGASRHSVALRDEFKADDIHPLHYGNTPFDFETIFARLDGDTGDSSGNAMDDVCARRAVLKLAGLAVGLIFDWLLEVNLKDARAVKAVGVRACAAAWVIDPEHFDGASLTKVARSLGYSSQAAISPEAADFSRRFGITNHFQAHAPDKEVYEPPATN